MLHEKILKTLEDNGYTESYLVGGCVRDLLLYRTPKDYDITTVARPEQVKELFPDSKMVGEHFGVTLISEGKESVEVATFRSDGAYTDSRRPDSVQFTDNILEDLQRRDFTVNAMARRSDGGTVGVMYCESDLHNNIIRSVGDPEQRFREDALRMLRAVRFACQLSFTIHQSTKDAIRKLAPLVKNLSAERIAQELNKILLSERPGYGISLLYDLELVSELFDIQGFSYYLKDTWLLMAAVPRYENVSLSLMLSALFLYSAKFAVKRPSLGYITYPKMAATSAGIARTWMSLHKYSNEDIYNVTNTLECLQLTDDYLRAEIEPSKADWKRLMRRCDFLDVVQLLYTDRIVTDTDSSDSLYLKSIYRTYLAEGLNPTPLVTGDDLIKLGYKPCREFGDVLDQMETFQLNGIYSEKSNRKDVLDQVEFTCKGYLLFKEEDDESSE